MFDEQTEKQKELFEEFQKPDKGFRFFKGNSRFLQNRTFILQLSIERAVFVSIIAVILVIVTFCIGVERGKRIQQKVLNAVQMKPSLTASSIQDKKDQIVQTVPQLPLSKKREDYIYTIRVATYLSKKSAEAVVAKIKKEGFPVYFVTSGRFLMICVGDYYDKKQAEAVLSALKKRYKDSYIKTVKK